MADRSEQALIGKWPTWISNRSKLATAAFTTLMPANGARTRLIIVNRDTNATNIQVKDVNSGIVYDLAPGASIARNRKTGGVWMGEIQVLGATGGEQVDAEEG